MPLVEGGRRQVVHIKAVDEVLKVDEVHQVVIIISQLRLLVHQVDGLTRQVHQDTTIVMIHITTLKVPTYQVITTTTKKKMIPKKVTTPTLQHLSIVRNIQI